jgi:hypothetical protein
MYHFDAPIDFKNSNLARPLHHRRVHRLKDHQEPDHHGHTNHNLDRQIESRQIVGRHRRKIFLHGANRIFLHAGYRLDRFFYLIGIGGIIQFDVEHGMRGRRR